MLKIYFSEIILHDGVRDFYTNYRSPQALIASTGRKLTILSIKLKLLSAPIYSKTCVKRPLKNRQNKDLYDKW